MPDQVLITLGYCLCAIVAVILAALVTRWWRDNAPEREKEPPREVVLRVSVDLPTIERVGTMLTSIVAQDRGLAQVDHLHSLSNVTVEQIGELLVDAFRAYHREAVNAPIPRAQPITMPPQPEERIANDLKRAKAIARGADELIAFARNQGQTMPRADALEEAARMLESTLNNT